MIQSVLLEELSWFDVQRYLEKECLIMLPIGSIEQHGPHLPLGTDSVNIQYLACKAAEVCNVLVAPTIRPGVSFNHIDFPGTISLQPETLTRIIEDMVSSLASHGFKKIILLNGHGGNNASIEVAAINLKRSFRDILIGILHSWLLSKEGAKVLESPIRYHADEGETSRTLISAKHLVKMERAKMEIPKSQSGLFNFQITQVFNQTTFYGLPRTKSVTRSGVFGDPSIASEQKGQALYEEMIDNLISETKRLISVRLEDYVEG